MKFVHVRNFVLAADDDSYDYMNIWDGNQWFSTFWGTYENRRMICYSYDWNTEYDDSIPIRPESNSEFLGEQSHSIFLSQKYKDQLKIELSVVPYQDICDIEEEPFWHEGFETSEVGEILRYMARPRGYCQLYMYDENDSLCAPMFRVIVSDVKLKRVGGHVVEIAFEFTADSGHGYYPQIRTLGFNPNSTSYNRTIYTHDWNAPDICPVKMIIEFNTKSSSSEDTITIVNSHSSSVWNHGYDATEETIAQNFDPQYYLVIDGKKQLIYYSDDLSGEPSESFPLENFNLKYPRLFPDNNEFVFSTNTIAMTYIKIMYRETVYELEVAPEPRIE